MQMWFSDENSVSPSVKCVICDKTKVVPAFLYYMKYHLP